MRRHGLLSALLVALALAGCGGSSNHTARWRSDWAHAEEKGRQYAEGTLVAPREETTRAVVAGWYDEFVKEAHPNAGEEAEAQKVREQEENRPQVESEAAQIKKHREAEHLANEQEHP